MGRDACLSGACLRQDSGSVARRCSFECFSDVDRRAIEPGPSPSLGSGTEVPKGHWLQKKFPDDRVSSLSCNQSSTQNAAALVCARRTRPLRLPGPERDGLSENRISPEHAEIAAVETSGCVAEDEVVAEGERHAAAPTGKRTCDCVKCSYTAVKPSVNEDDMLPTADAAAVGRDNGF